jgi:hypothetical protein
MAHYIAESIQAAEGASGDDRLLKLKHCADAIFAFWEHRHRLPNGMRPFENFEPIFSALQSLDLRDNSPRYYRPSRLAATEGDQEPEAATWLRIADGLDGAARMLIRYCLSHAAQVAVDKSRSWVALAEAAGIECDLEFPVIRIVCEESDLLTANEPDDEARRQIEDRINKLDAFTKMAAHLAAEMRLRLQSTGVSKKPRRRKK